MTERFAHEMQAGESYQPLQFTVTPELNQQFLYAVEDFSSIFIEGRDGLPPLVHPVLLMHMSPRTRSPSYKQAPGMGSAFASDNSTYLSPGYVNDTFEVQWRITRTYPKRDKIYQEYVAEIRNSKGEIILRRELASTFFSQGKVKGLNGDHKP